MLRPQTLLVLLAAASLAQAGWFEDTLNDVVRRQEESGLSSTPSTPTVSPSTTSPSETTTEPTTPSVSSTASPTPSTTEPPISTTTTSSFSSSTTAAPSSSTTQPSSTSTQVSSSTTSSREDTTSPITTPSPTVIKVTQTTTIDGNVVTKVSESTSTIKPTSTASLNNGSESSGSGMSSKTRSTVIGVVVGIGGAALLGGLAIVAWRIWGRKKSVAEGDDFNDYSRPDTGAEKSGSAGSSTNPFQSTLENYHNPAAKGNASTNF